MTGEWRRSAKWATRFESVDGSMRKWEPRRTWLGAWLSARFGISYFYPVRVVDRMPKSPRGPLYGHTKEQA